MAELENDIRNGYFHRKESRDPREAGGDTLSPRLQTVANAEPAVVRIGAALVASHLLAAAYGRNASRVSTRRQGIERALDRGPGGAALRLPPDSRGIGGLRHGFERSPGCDLRHDFLAGLFAIP